MTDQNQANTPAFQVAERNIDDVLAGVKDGAITAEDALAQEEDRGEEARTSLVSKLKAIINPPAKADDAPKAGNGKVRVKVAERATKGAAYYDPAQKATIGAKPVTVERTPFVKRLLLSGELVEA